MTFQKRITQAFNEEAARRADAAEPRLTKTDLWKAAGASSGAATHWFNGSNGMDMATCMKVAPLLRVNAQWLYDGTAPKLPARDGSLAAAALAVPPAPWPFPGIPEEQVRALPPDQLNKLQGALALAIAQLKLGIDVSPTPAAPQMPTVLRSDSLIDTYLSRDEFPLRIDGLPPAPWEGGKTTHQTEREGRVRISTQTGVVANVGVGEPPAANDRFEKVPELADVRLAAGEPIENHAEEQTGMIQFRKSFLRSVGADNGKGRVVYAKGDSMEPVIRDGAALLVVPNESLTLRDIAAGGVYAINYDGKMIVKTVARERLAGQWVARSFNPLHDDIPLENGASVRVLGRVVWAGARLRDDEAGQWRPE
ncbi:MULTISPECIES: S24 family peptidase [Achromobacter]|uniref:S24 family peptidase n=1 Tax=Achromobacter sp. TaxID=134375 RepID=UPI002F920515